MQKQEDSAENSKPDQKGKNQKAETDANGPKETNDESTELKNDKNKMKKKGGKNKNEEQKDESLTLQSFGINDDENFKPALITKVKELMQGKEKGDLKKGVKAISQWRLQSDIDVKEFSLVLA